MNKIARINLNSFLAIISILCLILHQTNAQDTNTTGLIKKNAMIVSAHELASNVGRDIMLKGGNAFDAAAGVHFALTVVYPQAGNIGGGGFAVFHTETGDNGALDFREKAPLAATKDMYLDENKDIIKGKSTVGHLAIGVPGSVDGIIELHKKYGMLPFREVIQPAIDLAYYGHAINAQLANDLNRFQEVFSSINNRHTVYHKKTPWEKGDHHINQPLAATLILIRDKGRDGFYKGIVADMIVKESNAGHGIITKDDLAAYRSKWRKPTTGMYKGYEIITMPPPSSGGIALIQMLQGADMFDFAQTGHNTATTIHQMIEIERRVYADRATYLGDPDYFDVPTEMLLDSAYNATRFATIKEKKATPSSKIKEGKVDIIESVETTHFSVIDRNGNAVSITTTLNSYFGSKVIVNGGGFFLNNEMDDFSAKPGVPNQFGLVGGEANSIAPEKRMLSSMTPTIVLKNNDVKMVVGTPGGSTIITSVYQVILNVIDHNMTMQQAVDAAKFHSQWLPDKVYFEKGKFDEKTLKKLKKMKHQTDTKPMLGKLECIKVLDDGSFEGAPDRTRNESAAAGF